jgi:hypothetical protein
MQTRSRCGESNFFIKSVELKYIYMHDITISYGLSFKLLRKILLLMNIDLLF